MSGNGQLLSFTYNADGIRTSKTVNGITHYYHLAGTQILSEEWTDANEVQHLIIYHYDANGQPVGMSYRNSTQGENEYDSFLFVKNLQGDIIKVLDDEGDLLASYSYDAWGNPTSTTYSNSGASTAVVYNPFRYRGYYYDSELGFYYLNSRYYDSSVGRFINADIFVNANKDIVGFNMFAYCSNNPIVYVDQTGYNKFKNWLIEKSLGVKEFFSENFGIAVYSSNSYDKMQVDTFFGGMEKGKSSSCVLYGDNSKPITFYLQNADEWWKFWDCKTGINVNIGDGGFNMGISLSESTFTVCDGNSSYEFISGIEKAGVTISHEVDFKSHTAGPYIHAYYRPWTVVPAVLLAIYCPSVAVAAGTAAVALSP